MRVLKNLEGVKVAEKKDDTISDSDMGRDKDVASHDDAPVRLESPDQNAPSEKADDVDASSEPTLTEDPSDDTPDMPDEDTASDAEASQSEPTSIEPAPAPVKPEPKQQSPVPLVIGGVIAALLGFLAARADLLDNLLPPSMRLGADAVVANEKIDNLQGALNAANAKIDALEDQITAAEAVEVFDASELESSVAALGERIQSLEKRPVATADGSAPNYDADFAELQDMARKQQEEIDRLLTDARLVEESSEAAAKAALARAAATRIVAAVESGAPFDAALDDLASTGVEVPAELSDAAPNGVTQLAELQGTIPQAARTALAASRSADTSGGLGGFFQRQLGARSVTPKEGSDPDAVLSRVEAAVREGRLNDALAEAETLPPEGQAAMADWLEQARTRLDVTTATEALMQRLAAN